MEELYALSPFKPIFIAKSVQGVGDFQVAIGGGFWVAVRAEGLDHLLSFVSIVNIPYNENVARGTIDLNLRDRSFCLNFSLIRVQDN